MHADGKVILQFTLLGLTMGIYEFRRIVSGFCKEAALQDSSAIASGKAFLIHQCLVWLQYIEVADLCRIVIDLGKPANGISSNVAQMMLESNCGSHSRYLPFLGINGKDGHALLMLHLPLSMLSHEIKLYFLLDQQLFPLIKAWQSCFASAGELVSDANEVLPNCGFA